MGRAAVRGYDDLNQEEIELITDTVRRRIGGMFLRARHPKRRNKKGRYQGSAGEIFAPTRNLEWLVSHIKTKISRQGVLANPAVTNVAIRRVITELVMKSEIWYEGGAWNMNASLMDMCREQSQRLSEEAKARRAAERMNRGFVPPVQRQRRRSASMA